MQAEPAETEELPHEAQSRILQSEGEEWVVREAGSTRSGSGSDRGAPLLLLRFSRVAAPDAPLREALAVSSSLDEIEDEDLEELFRRSRSVS
jgi:hypothetical protein